MNPTRFHWVGTEPHKERTKMQKTNVVAAVGLLVATTFATSVSAYDRIDRRQDRQQYRIEQGIRDGSITPDEARRLRQAQRRIAREEWLAKSDGWVTPDERARIEAMQDRENQRIARLRSDDDRRSWYRDYRP